MIVICGPGAVGLRLAADLSLRGEEVALFGRLGPTARTVSYQSHDQVAELNFPELMTMLSDLSISAIFVCVKAYDVKEALRALDQAGFVHVPTVVLSNGYYEGDIEAFLGRDTLILGATNIASKVRGSTVQRTDEYGKVYIPVGDGKIPSSISDLLVKYPDLFARVDANIRKRKWIVNSTLNTLCGALKLERNGDALEHLSHLERLFSEAFALADKLMPGQPLHKKETYDWLLETIHSTADNQNSMYSDVVSKRRPEIEYLSGLASKEYPILFEYTRRIQGFYT